MPPGRVEGVFCLLFLAQLANAYVDFQINCTAPGKDDRVNFVSSPSVRSTTDILWPCLSVLLLCTWNAQHPSVPAHYIRKEPGKLGAIKKQLRKSWERAKWMTIMVVMPEYMFGKAMTEHFAARRSHALFDDPAWTMVHAYFANMRGFVFSFEVRAVPTDLEPTRTGKVSKEGTGVTRFSEDPEIPYVPQDEGKAIEIELQHCKEICRVGGVGPCRNHPSMPNIPLHSDAVGALLSAELILGFGVPAIKDKIANATTIANPRFESHQQQEEELNHSKVTEKGPQQHPPPPPPPPPPPQTADEVLGPHKPWRATWALSADQLYYAYRERLIKVPTRVAAEAIQDRSKGDGLSKGLAILQITWLVVQIVARAAQDLAVTLLEITVLAFATTAIAIYITVWDKPQNVDVPIVIEADRIVERKHIIQLAARAPKSSMFVHEFWLHGVNCRTMADNIFPYAPGLPVGWPSFLGGNKSTAAKHHISPIFVGIGLGGAIFGAVHCAAWDFAFPTPPEQLLWRIACVFIMASPVPAAFFYVYTQHSAKIGRRNETWTHALMLPLYIMMPVYLLARMYLMVEALRALAYPVSSTFQTVNWPGMIPHIG